MTADQFCTFTLAGQHFGIIVDDVQEVIRHRPGSRVPLAPAAVVGLMNLRGRIVPVIDLRTRLALPPQPAGAEPFNVVVRTKDGPKALVVDDIGDVLTLDEGTFEPTPGTVRGPAGELVRGAHKLADRLLLILDVPKVLTYAPAAAG
ncbi:chemotaxis protein CheW [Limnoglobus roseus]|uniref:Chemotaxis protein CheW n=1 Tax=Limnoglobus roseus TaxID=2598579 RepID=A0A5C1A3Y4_9BACT|nr:chemotaxis protein CheW [Limnoglobus roseus]QEL13779.1 chemotaxis protein CheW [Limnoglobus roseus]